MDDAQTWTLISFIGVFASGLLAITWAAFRDLGGRIDSLRDTIGARIDTIGERLAELSERLTRLEVKVDGLDRDVQAVTDRWGRGEV